MCCCCCGGGGGGFSASDGWCWYYPSTLVAFFFPRNVENLKKKNSFSKNTFCEGETLECFPIFGLHYFIFFHVESSKLINYCTHRHAKNLEDLLLAFFPFV